MNLFKNRNDFKLKHRLSTTQDAKKIAVFDNGEIVDIGTHSELIGKDGIYKDLCEKQLINKY